MMSRNSRRRSAKQVRPAATAIYARLSQDRRKEGTKVDRQVSDCRKLAELKGLIVDDEMIFIDNDISATNGKVRPGFESLIAAIDSGRIGAVLVWHMDRLVRLMPDLLRVINAGREMGFGIISVNGQSLDMSDPTGVAVAQILVAIAEMEGAHKAERQYAAMEIRQDAGKWNAIRDIYGYTKSGEVIEHEATYVREVYRQAILGKSLRDIARWLTGEGVINRSGNPFTRKSLRSMLTNPRYNAQLAVKSGHNWEREVINPHGDWEAIIDADTFETAFNLITDPARNSGPGNSARWLGAGFYECGTCGGKLSTRYNGQSKRDENGKRTIARGYGCDDNRCMSRSKAEQIDAMVELAVTEQFARPDWVEWLADDEDTTLATALKAERARLVGQRDGLIIPDDFDGTAEDMQVMMRLVGKRIADIREQIELIDEQIDELNSDSALALLVGSNDPGADWMALPIATKRQIAAELVRVTLTKVKMGPQPAMIDPATITIEPIRSLALVG